MPDMMRNLLREPLVHFIGLGLGLFLLYQAVAGGRGGEERRVVVDEATVAGLVETFRARWQREPTPPELRGLVAAHVREEILHRQGVLLGLDRDDPVIRRRVVQKLEVIAEESAGGGAPGDDELEAHLREHAARFSQPAVVAFEQVLLDPARAAAGPDAEAALARLRAGADPAGIGGASLLPPVVAPTPADVVARDFGADFAAALLALPVGEWRGPVASGFGAHLVRVTARMPGRTPALAEVRTAVERDWESERRVQARDAYYEVLRRDYAVVVEVPLPGDGGAVP